MSQLNLKYIKKLSIPPTKSSHVSKHESLQREKIIRKAMEKHCSPGLAEKAMDGFRRSASNDAAAEEDFLRTNLPDFKLKRDWHYQRALRVVKKLFQPSQPLKPVAFPDLRYYPWNLAVSAEAPYTYYRKKWNSVLLEKARDGLIDNTRATFHNLYNEIFVENQTALHFIKRKMFPYWKDGKPQPYYWTTLHSRSHLVKSDEPDKIRAVFGVPKLVLMTENMFIWPLQAEYLNKKVDSPLLWGYETIRGGWKKLHRDLTHKVINTVLSIDWSQFDKRMLHEMIDDVHCIWYEYFDFEHGFAPTNFYPNSTTPKEKIDAIWEWMCEQIKHQWILAPSGRVFQWQTRSFASGFQQTQLMDSFVNALMILTCLSSLGINIEAENFQIKVQGDDSLVTCAEIFSDHDSFLRSLEKEAKLRFDAVLSVKKSEMSSYLSGTTVLSYSNENGIAKRDPADLLAHLAYPERPQRLAETAASCVGIAQANMGNSKEVYDVCRDAFDFITVNFGITPEMSSKMIRRAVFSGKSTSTTFPPFEETFLANYSYEERSENENEKLWPTKIESAGGFYFL